MKFREEKFTVKTYECQPDGNIKMASLMLYLQEVAARHAEQLGFGFGLLSHQGDLPGPEIRLAKRYSVSPGLGNGHAGHDDIGSVF